MNRPRNRQPRPPRQNQQRAPPKASNSGGRAGAPATPQQAAGTVPKSRQVVPGTAVFIVLKEDQPTGRETRGVVQDVLTSGDHPRGVKVRLRDGQVGRVQRLDDGSSSAASSGFGRRYEDVRLDEYPQEPPPRSLADFMPDLGDEEEGRGGGGGEVTAVCPICEAFEGDEAAVTHHIDREHLS